MPRICSDTERGQQGGAGLMSRGSGERTLWLLGLNEAERRKGQQESQCWHQLPSLPKRENASETSCRKDANPAGAGGEVLLFPGSPAASVSPASAPHSPAFLAPRLPENLVCFVLPPGPTKENGDSPGMGPCQASGTRGLWVRRCQRGGAWSAVHPTPGQQKAIPTREPGA